MSILNSLRSFFNRFESNPTLKELVENEVYYNKKMENHRSRIKTGRFLLKSDDSSIRRDAMWIIESNTSMYESYKAKRTAAFLERKREETRIKREKREQKRIQKEKKKREEEEEEYASSSEQDQNDMENMNEILSTEFDFHAQIPSAPPLPIGGLEKDKKKNMDDAPSAPPIHTQYSRHSSQSRQSRQSRNPICVICYDDLDDRKCMTTRCDHRYHKDCYHELIKSSDLCPLCRCRLD